MVKITGIYRVVSGTTDMLPVLLIGTILELTNQKALLLSPGGLACERVRPSLRRANARQSLLSSQSDIAPPYLMRRLSARRGAMLRPDSHVPCC
jgi:hypothetical protein